MREILALFTEPEACVQEMIRGKSSRTVGKGIINIAQIALLIGLIIALGIRTILPYFVNLLSYVGLGLSESFLQFGDVKAGISLIILAFIIAIIIVIAAILYALIMTVLLFIIRFLVGGNATFKELFLITIFSQVIMVTVIFVYSIVFMLTSMIPNSEISDIVMSIVTLFGFWYLIFIIVGFNVANKVSFFRSIVAILLMQSILWMPFYILFTRISAFYY